MKPMSTLLLFNFAVLLLLHSPYKHDPIILSNRADLSRQDIRGLVRKLKQLQHTVDEVSMFECANVHWRLLKPTQKAIRYCKQLLNGTDRFKRPANAQLVRHFSRLTKNATYCDEAHFERAKAGLAELLERDGSYTIDEQQVQQAIKEFILELKLSILETELTAKIAAFTNPCIYGKEFKQLSQAIKHELAEFGYIVEAWPKALKENFQEKLYKFVQFAREQSEPLKQTFWHKLDAISSKSKTTFEALKQNFYEWKKSAATQSPEAKQKKFGQIIWQTKQIFANFSLDMQNIGIPRHDIDEKNGHVEVFEQIIKIVQEEIESEKQEMNETFKFKMSNDYELA
uniref:Uncharacterized protein n=1 Tax=Globodera rostochiensis TaxID=31243 RepID=A0A914GPQ4_GLORO